VVSADTGRYSWSACGQQKSRNGVRSGTTCMYCRRSAPCAPTKIELLKRVSAVRICPGAQSVLAGQGDVDRGPLMGPPTYRHAVGHVSEGRLRRSGGASALGVRQNGAVLTSRPQPGRSRRSGARGRAGRLPRTPSVWRRGQRMANGDTRFDGAGVANAHASLWTLAPGPRSCPKPSHRRPGVQDHGE